MVLTGSTLVFDSPRVVTMVRGRHRGRWGGCPAARISGMYLYRYAMRRHPNPNLANSCFTTIGLLTLLLAFYDYRVPMSKIAELCDRMVR